MVGIKARVVIGSVVSLLNPTNHALLFYPKLEPCAPPELKITVIYGDDDIFGDSTQYTKERLSTVAFHTIRSSNHFPWLQNEEAFYKVLATH